ncbi:hypothetical protein IWW54_006753, partial [Coemansia sp. RSA 2705]
RTFTVDGDAVSTSIELHARFLEHCLLHNRDAAVVILETLCQAYDVPATDIHVVVQQQGLDEDGARRVLRAYYALWDVPAAHHCYFGS